MEEDLYLTDRVLQLLAVTDLELPALSGFRTSMARTQALSSLIQSSRNETQSWPRQPLRLKMKWLACLIKQSQELDRLASNTMKLLTEVRFQNSYHLNLSTKKQNFWNQELFK